MLLGKLGKMVVVVGNAPHNRPGFLVDHLIGNRASFLCTKAPMVRVPETNFLQGITSISGQDVQATFFRRRHQPRMPPLAKIRPGSPAPAMGPGTGDVPLATSEIFCANVLAILPSELNSAAPKVKTPVPVRPGVTVTSTVQVVEEVEQLLSSEGVNTEELVVIAP